MFFDNKKVVINIFNLVSNNSQQKKFIKNSNFMATFFKTNYKKKIIKIATMWQSYIEISYFLIAKRQYLTYLIQLTTNQKKNFTKSFNYVAILF